MVTSPIDRGGLGIPDLSRFTTALRLRWLWLAWKSPDRPWVGSGSPCDDNDRALFATATVVTIRSSEQASFWHCNWLGGRPLKQSFPDLFNHSIRKNQTVAAALLGDHWVHDLRHGNVNNILPQFVQLLRAIREARITLTAGQRDDISWTAGGAEYSAGSAYDLQFSDRPRT